MLSLLPISFQKVPILLRVNPGFFPLTRRPCLLPQIDFPWLFYYIPWYILDISVSHCHAFSCIFLPNIFSSQLFILRKSFSIHVSKLSPLTIQTFSSRMSKSWGWMAQHKEYSQWYCNSSAWWQVVAALLVSTV